MSDRYDARRSEVPATPLTIMLVEDRDDDIRLALRALRRAKFQNEVLTFTDGEQALTFLKSGMPPRPDLVLLDLGLPKLSGSAVLLGIRDDPVLAQLPVVILTATGKDTVPETALAADAFIPKPVNPERLLAVVQKLAGIGWALVRVSGSTPYDAASPPLA